MSTTVCLCKHVSEETIVKAFKEGANTVEKLKVQTGASNGVCKGARCTKRLQDLIEKYK